MILKSFNSPADLFPELLVEHVREPGEEAGEDLNPRDLRQVVVGGGLQVKMSTIFPILVSRSRVQCSVKSPAFLKGKCMFSKITQSLLKLRNVILSFFLTFIKN